MDKKKVFLVVFCVCLPLFLILFSYKVNLFFTELNSEQQNVVNFLKYDEELRLNFTLDEVSHLEDVKLLMKYLDYLFYALLLGLTLIITNFKRNTEYIRKLFLYGGISSVGGLLIVLLFVLFLWNQTFTYFHMIFFPQGNWQFAFDSVLIKTFPIDFFFTISRNMFITAGFLGSIFILLSLLFKYGLGVKDY